MVYWQTVTAFMLFVTCATLTPGVAAQEAVRPDRTTATGFFHTERIGDVWWLISPDGERFVSIGVNHVSYTADVAPQLGYAPYGRVTTKKYGSEDAWAAAVVPRLKSWGFNSIGAWSSSDTYKHDIAYTIILNLGTRAGGDWLSGSFPDVFSEAFEEAIRNAVAAECGPRRNDRQLLGYFTDNELKWGPDWRSPQGLFAGYWELPTNADGRRKAVSFLRSRYQDDFTQFAQLWQPEATCWDEVVQSPTLTEVSPLVANSQQKLVRNKLLSLVPRHAVMGYLLLQYGTIRRFNDAEIPMMGKKAGTDFKSFAEVASPQPLSRFDQELAAIEAGFTHQVATRYFQVCGTAIRRHDPNHLILGCRFAMRAPEEVATAMGDHVDVVSLNYYDANAPTEHGREIYGWTGKPILITEFGFKAMDSGLPNSKGAGLPVATQQDRADSYEKYVTDLMALPTVVGFHWFEHADEPAEGRFDGEDCNYGLVNIKDEPWQVLTNRMSEVNARVVQIHQEAEGHRP